MQRGGSRDRGCSRGERIVTQQKALAIHSSLANANYHVIRFLASREPSLLEPAYTNLVNVRDELHQVIAVLENFERSAPLINNANVGLNLTR